MQRKYTKCRFIPILKFCCNSFLWAWIFEIEDNREDSYFSKNIRYILYIEIELVKNGIQFTLLIPFMATKLTGRSNSYASIYS
jgi:hypothetical protein